MGILMGFYAGDARKIAEVIADEESDVDLHAAPFVRSHADFSLHIMPEDLDPLLATVCSLKGAPERTLADALVEQLAGPENPETAEYSDEHSVDLVDPEVVALLASLRSEELPSLIGAWCRGFNAEPTSDAERAVRELVQLCQIAQRERLDVVFTWSL